VRKPIIVGNWKMHKTHAETVRFVEELLPRLAGLGEDRDIVICPPFTSLAAGSALLRGRRLRLGAQHMHWEEQGAFTGEVSPLMLRALGCSYVIVGHSERRQYFGETDQTVNRRLVSALQHQLVPIFCLGETLAERQRGEARTVCQRQLEQGLAGIEAEALGALVVAYEPVWAIGTGENATPDDAQEMISFLRRQVAAGWGEVAAGLVRIQYGGSVRPDTIEELMAQPDIDGVLVGGASLEVGSFAAIAGFGRGGGI